MAGGPSGGQKLTPNPNTFATAGFGGDRWGANGGGITPVGGGVTGLTGYDKSVAVTLADAETAANYLLNGTASAILQPVGITGLITSLLHLSNGVLDSAIPAPVWTPGGTSGTASLSSGEAQFGTQSLFMSGPNCWIDSPLKAGNPLDLTQQANFTVSCWVFPTSVTTANASLEGQAIILDYSGGGATLFHLYMAQTVSKLTVQLTGGNGWSGSVSTAAALNINAWNHVVFERAGLTLYLGLNGVLITSPITGNPTGISGNQDVFIGGSPNIGSNAGWDGGYIQEVQIVTGQALYSGSSYTIPSAPQANPSIGNLPFPPPPELSILSTAAQGATSLQTFDDSLISGNSNAG